MKILVTGGSGYLGSLLVPKLLHKEKEKHHVILFDNFSFGMHSILHFANHERLSIVQGDIRNKSEIQREVQKADLIIHLAAIVGYPACASDPHKATTINVEGSKNIAKKLSKNQRVIFASTGSTYGKVDGICDENAPIAPLTLYGSTKAEGEKFFLEKNGVALRFATVFGVSPRLRLDLLVNDFVHQALHNKQIVLFEGSFKRTFLHVSDAARSFEFTMKNYENMQGSSYNIGDESMNYRKKDIALLIKEKINFYLHEANIGSDEDKRDYEVSYKRIKSLGFRTKINIRQGIDELIKILEHLKVYSEWRNA